jgi:hypothetical protein
VCEKMIYREHTQADLRFMKGFASFLMDLDIFAIISRLFKIVEGWSTSTPNSIHHAGKLILLSHKLHLSEGYRESVFVFGANSKDFCCRIQTKPTGLKRTG